MCGLAGGVGLTPRARPDADRVRRMSALVAHRGPDADGLWISPSGTACLAHRRLSIIDLDTGQQPLVSADDRTCLIFNGEVYNYVELRDRLEAEGRRFTTESDTEVLREALLHWGDDAVRRCIGMFAFAFWDEDRRRLLLARDRVGKKPLYHAVVDDCLYFCSTLRGLEAALAGSPVVDATSVANFLNLGYIPAPDTIYRDVAKLPPASMLSVGAGRRPELQRYWDPIHDPSDDGHSRPLSLDGLESLLEDAVRLRLRSDVPLGVFLSGGVDSSLVAALATRLSPNRVQTFTVGFGDAEFDEADRARRIARHLGTDHHEFMVDTDVLDLLPRIVEHFGEPFADSSALPVWKLAEVARQHITVALMGDGGDEGFAGYNWYRTASRLDTLARFTGLGILGPATRALTAPLGIKARRLGYLVTASPAERFANLRCMFGRHTLQPSLFTPDFDAQLDDTRTAAGLLERYYEQAEVGALHSMQYADLRSYLPGDLLPKVDVCTMAHSLEARAPLLDHRVLEFAFRLPPSLQDAWRPKAMLRNLLARHLPPELTDGPKMGFSVPLKNWFRAELRPMVEQLPEGELAKSGWLDEEAVSLLVRQHLSGQRDNSARLFHLLVLQMWMSR